MKKSLLIIIAILFISACSGGDAKELYETAQFEELQNNHKHAVQLYEEIITKHSDTDFAKKAIQRIKELKNNNTGK